MTDTDLAPDDLGELTTVPREGPVDVHAALRSIDHNFVQFDEAFGALRDELDQLKRRPPRERRTGAGARLNPDTIWIAWAIMGGVALFAAAALLASFAGQYAMAVYTHLPVWLWWVVPLFIEFPIVVLSFAIPVFRRRRQRGANALAWSMLWTLTIASSLINITHVGIESGFAEPGDIVGAAIMGAAPILVLLSFEVFVLLVVRPEPQPQAPAAPVKRTTTKKGTRR